MKKTKMPTETQASVPVNSKPQDPNGPQVPPETQYLQALFERARQGDPKLDPAHKVMIEMMAESEQRLHGAIQQANKLEKEIYDRNVALRNLNDAILNERGKAQGLAEALLSLRDTSKAKKPDQPASPPPAPAQESEPEEEDESPEV